MRKTFFLVFSLILALPLHVNAVHNVRFVGEMVFGRPLSIAVDKNGRCYTSQKDGSVKARRKDGNMAMTLGGAGSEGSYVLKDPGAIAPYGQNVYIVDKGMGTIVIFTRDGTYVDSFGNKGKDIKEFNDPEGIFVYKGVIYVADSGNRRVQVFGPNGVYIGCIGVEGGERETLKYPTDVAVDYRGFVYVVDSKDNRLKIYKQSGEYFGKIDIKGRPLSIGMSNDGFYVSDIKKYNINKYDFNGNQLFSFGSHGEGRAQFLSLNDICVDSEGNVYTADLKRCMVQVFSPEKGKAFEEWEMSPPPFYVEWLEDIGVTARKIRGDAEGNIYAVDRRQKSILVIKKNKIVKNFEIPGCTPVSVALGPKGFLWVLDERKGRVIKLDHDGKVLMSFGSSGHKEGYLSKPIDMVISEDGIIYVADRGNHRIQAFNVDGMFLKVITKKKKASVVENPLALALDSKGVLYALDDKECMVSLVSPEGTLIKSFGGKGEGRDEFHEPVSITVTDNEIFVLDNHKNNVKVFNRDGEFLRLFGSYGKGRGSFKDPTCIAAVDDIHVLVSDTGNGRIQKLLTVYTPSTPADTLATGGMRSVKLQWNTNPETFVEKYKIYRSEESKFGFKEIGSTASNIYEDSDVKGDMTYYYRVSAVARKGSESKKSMSFSAKSEKYVSSAPQGLKAVTDEWAVHLSWNPSDEHFVSYYVIYWEQDGVFTKITQSNTPSFLMKSLDPGSSYTFKVTAVSSDGVEGEGAVIEAATKVQTKPPLEIEVLEMHNVFSNTYKIYETDGIGRLQITNNTRSDISTLKISFGIKEFMDFTSEMTIESLGALESREVALKAVFNNKILNVTEDTPVQAEIEVTYYIEQAPQTYSKNYTLNIYEKHRLMWDVKERFATFITPKDSVLLDFTRSIVTQYGEQDQLLYAVVLFDAMGTMGITYMQDPSNPYQITSGKTDFVDYIQYPRETLQRRSGDCDDLVGLYCAALESLGIRTKVLEVPGHMLMMFASGIRGNEDMSTMDGMFVVHEGQLWVPVETTMVGSSFIRAWEVGSKTYNGWKERGLTMMDIRDSWKRFKPASLPLAEWKPEPLKRDAIDSKFNNEFSSIRKLKILYLGKKYLDILELRPKDLNAMLQLGIVYAKEGEIGESAKVFEKALSYFPENADLLNNMGNIHFIGHRYSQAQSLYEKAAAKDPDDAFVLVNLARCHLRLGSKQLAKEAFSKAYSLDPSVSNKYRTISLELLGTI
ncbi:MAG: fibronectin type III domain-containing protein [bacterium]